MGAASIVGNVFLSEVTRFGVLQRLGAVGFPLLTLVAAFLLFKRRRGAVVALGLILTLSATNSVVKFLTFDALTARGMLGSIVMWELLPELLFLTYAVQLRRQGVLN